LPITNITISSASGVSNRLKPSSLASSDGGSPHALGPGSLSTGTVSRVKAGRGTTDPRITRRYSNQATQHLTSVEEDDLAHQENAREQLEDEDSGGQMSPDVVIMKIIDSNRKGLIRAFSLEDFFFISLVWLVTLCTGFTIGGLSIFSVNYSFLSPAHPKVIQLIHGGMACIILGVLICVSAPVVLLYCQSSFLQFKNVSWMIWVQLVLVALVELVAFLLLTAANISSPPSNFTEGMHMTLLSFIFSVLSLLLGFFYFQLRGYFSRSSSRSKQSKPSSSPSGQLRSGRKASMQKQDGSSDNEIKKTPPLTTGTGTATETGTGISTGAGTAAGTGISTGAGTAAGTGISTGTGTATGTKPDADVQSTLTTNGGGSGGNFGLDVTRETQAVDEARTVVGDDDTNTSEIERNMRNQLYFPIYKQHLALTAGVFSMMSLAFSAASGWVVGVSYDFTISAIFTFCLIISNIVSILMIVCAFRSLLDRKTAGMYTISVSLSLSLSSFSFFFFFFFFLCLFVSLITFIAYIHWISSILGSISGIVALCMSTKDGFGTASTSSNTFNVSLLIASTISSFGAIIGGVSFWRFVMMRTAAVRAVRLATFDAAVTVNTFTKEVDTLRKHDTSRGLGNLASIAAEAADPCNPANWFATCARSLRAESYLYNHEYQLERTNMEIEKCRLEVARLRAERIHLEQIPSTLSSKQQEGGGGGDEGEDRKDIQLPLSNGIEEEKEADEDEGNSKAIILE
jgi:hypothetical protein